MTLRQLLPLAAASLMIVGSSCSHKPSEAEVKREAWLISLNDSITRFQARRDTVSELITAVRTQVNNMASDFDYINNPREVEGYYILHGWKGKYPLTTTGMVARITETEGFELVATLSAKHFDEIAVTVNGKTLTSAKVPHDQALNYRTNDFTKVCFTGSKADSIGALVASSDGKGIKVTFLENKPVASINLSVEEGNMIARTWQFRGLQRHLHSLEGELPALSGKINACRRILEADSTKQK